MVHLVGSISALTCLLQLTLKKDFRAPCDGNREHGLLALFVHFAIGAKHASPLKSVVRYAAMIALTIAPNTASSRIHVLSLSY